MSGLTQAYRADGTSEGDIQALRPGYVRQLAVHESPVVYTPTAGTGIVEVEADGEALLHVNGSAAGMPLHAGTRYSYALADGFNLSFTSPSPTTVRILEGA